MNRKANWNRAGVSLGAVAFVTALGFATPALAAEAAADEDATGVVEITVTARKREEALLQTPIAISALSTKDIEQRGIVSMTDLVAVTPGINVTGNNAGRNDRSFQQISLRGFTPTTTDSTLTASFIDGVPVSSASALNSITDPARVEVLRGPQNAYFGRNAFAGAINVVNKLPGNTLGGSISASAYSREGYDVQGSLEGPIIPDVLSFRISGRSYQRGGSYINAANPAERLGDQRSRSGSAMLVFMPTTDLTIKAFGLYSRDNDGPSAQGMLSAYEVRANNGSVNIPALSGNTAGTVIVPAMSNCVLTGYFRGIDTTTETRTSNPSFCGAAPALPAGSPAQNTYISPLTTAALASGAYRPVSPSEGVQGYGLKRRYMHAHVNMDWELGDSGFTLSSLTGFNDELFSQMAELDNYDSSSLVNAAATTTNGLLPYFNFPFGIERVNRDFSQEVRVSFDNKGPLSGMIGANYLWAKAYRNQFAINTETVSGLPTTANRAATTMSSPQQVRTWGLFGSLNYDVTEQLTINLEGRYQRDKIYLLGGGGPATVTAAASATTGIPAGSYAPMLPYFAKSFNNFMPRVIVNFKPNPNVMAYASWSKAANVSIASFNARLFSGTAAEIKALQDLGVQAFTVPETLSNFEAGVKGKLLDGKVTYSLAAYAGEWKNQYNSRSVFGTTTVTGLANSGRVLVKGVELDLTAAPAQGITLSFSGAINDTNIRSFADPAITKLTGLVGNNFVGKSLPLTSKYSFAFSPQFSGAIPGRDNATWFIRTDVSYKSKQFTDASNYSWIKGRAVVNGRIGVTLDKVNLEVFATNLLNDRNYVSVANNSLQTPLMLNNANAAVNNTNLASSSAPSNNPFSTLILGLPELRTVGIKASTKF